MHVPTRRQREVLDLITRYVEIHGYRPAYQMIARQLGLKSRAGIARIVGELENFGLLTRVHTSDGHFAIELNRPGIADGSGSVIEWLEIPHDAAEDENWEFATFALPEFMLGGYDPATIKAFRVRDESLIADNICADDIALIELRPFPRDGNIVVAVINKKQTVLRKYYRAGADINLSGSDDRTEIISVPADTVAILGVYRGLVRPIF